MKKILITAKVDSHIMQFHIPYIKYFKDRGYEVHVASAGNEHIPYVDFKHDIRFGTNPFAVKNIENFKSLYLLMIGNDFDIVHTHTAIASVLTRFANHISRKKLGKKNRLIYTAHGYHFSKGGPLINWLLYYPIEKIMSKHTDDLILINKEDYNFAIKHKMARKVHYVNGVGIDEKRMNQIDSSKISMLKKHINLHENDIVITYVAELNKNKNHLMLLKTLKSYLIENKNVKLILCGTGDLQDKLMEWCKDNNLVGNVFFLGYTNMISEVLSITDIYTSVSKREGLPLNVIEAMYFSLPLIVTNCRGNRDLITQNKNGFIVDYSINELQSKIKLLSEKTMLREQFGIESRIMAQDYLLSKVYDKLIDIYEN